MKLHILNEAIDSKNLFYKNDYGYIKGYMRPDGYFWVDKIYVYPEYRGQGKAKELASHIPKKAMLLAQPLYVKGENVMDKDNLIKFYSSLGFQEQPDSNDNMIMVREHNELNEHLKIVKGKWALVSKHTGRVLRYYHGDGKPSKEWVSKMEKEIHTFENQ